MGPISNENVLTGDKKGTKRKHQCENGGRDWSYAATNQRTRATKATRKDSPLEPLE